MTIGLETAAECRFEQTAIELQPNAPSAMGMVAQDPVRMVSGRRATCDGGERLDKAMYTAVDVQGGGPLGHPKIFINLVSRRLCCRADHAG